MNSYHSSIQGVVPPLGMNTVLTSSSLPKLERQFVITEILLYSDPDQTPTSSLAGAGLFGPYQTLYVGVF